MGRLWSRPQKTAFFREGINLSRPISIRYVFFRTICLFMQIIVRQIDGPTWMSDGFLDPHGLDREIHICFVAGGAEGIDSASVGCHDQACPSMNFCVPKLSVSKENRKMEILFRLFPSPLGARTYFDEMFSCLVTN